MNLSIYLHWPFCRSKCPYCDFMSVPRFLEGEYEEVEDLLFGDLEGSLKELESPLIKTIFFGGGTPSLMTPKAIERVINFLAKNYKLSDDIEVSLEANPATFDENKLKDIKKAGINRLSLGVQSFEDKNLAFLGRIYRSEQALLAAEYVAKTFSNYSFDFMYGYQTQDIQDLRYDLSKAIEYGCPHVSCYQLTFEHDTPFYNKLQKGEILQISENQEILMYEFINKFLKERGFNRYEVSNYSLENFESKHNLAYWRYKDYLGVGPSAHSRLVIKNHKYELVKTSDIDTWKKQIINKQNAYEIKNKLSDLDQLEETFIVGLRISEGISVKHLEDRFDASLLSNLYERLNKLVNKNLINPITDRIQLSESGFIKMNSIINYLFVP